MIRRGLRAVAEWTLLGVELGCIALFLIAGIIAAPAFALGALAFVGTDRAGELAQRLRAGNGQAGSQK